MDNLFYKLYAHYVFSHIDETNYLSCEINQSVRLNILQTLLTTPMVFRHTSFSYKIHLTILKTTLQIWYHIIH